MPLTLPILPPTKEQCAAFCEGCIHFQEDSTCADDNNPNAEPKELEQIEIETVKGRVLQVLQIPNVLQLITGKNRYDLLKAGIGAVIGSGGYALLLKISGATEQQVWVTLGLCNKRKGTAKWE